MSEECAAPQEVRANGSAGPGLSLRGGERVGLGECVSVQAATPERAVRFKVCRQPVATAQGRLLFQGMPSSSYRDMPGEPQDSGTQAPSGAGSGPGVCFTQQLCIVLAEGVPRELSV